MRVKRAVTSIKPIATMDSMIVGNLLVPLKPRIRYVWRFACGHKEIRTSNTRSGNGATIDQNGKLTSYGHCKRCAADIVSRLEAAA